MNRETGSRTAWPGMAACAVAAVAALLACAGCERAASLSEIEARERASRLYTSAMDDLQAGRVDAAIREFEHVLVQEPGNYSAHFQLATLLQDIKKDYIGAISHYRSYLLFRPASDKATVASDRMRVCDTLLGAEYLRKAGGSATDKLSADNAKLGAARDALAVQVKRLEGQLAEAQKKVDQLTQQNKMFRRQISSIGAEAEGGSPKKGASAKEAVAELRAIEAEEKRRRLRPTDAELLDDDSPPEDRISGSVDVKSLKAELDREDKEDANKPQAQKKAVAAAKAKDEDVQDDVAKPAGKHGGKGEAKPGPFDALIGKKQSAAPGSRPETYVVQQGDTLFKVSMRFYGSSHKWRAIRDANKAIIPPDGRLRAGQEIRLP